MRERFDATAVLEILSEDVKPHEFYDVFFRQAQSKGLDLPALDPTSDLGRDQEVVQVICALSIKWVKRRQYEGNRSLLCDDWDISSDKAYRLNKFLRNTDAFVERSDNVYTGCERVLSVHEEDGIELEVEAREHGRPEETIEVEVEGNSASVNASNTKVGSIDDLLQKAGIDLDEWKKIDSHVGSHEQGMKLKQVEGYKDNGDPYFTYEPHIHTLYSYDVELERREVEPVEFAPLKPIEIEVSPAYEPQERQVSDPGLETHLMVPDPQIGFQRDTRTANFRPIHDRRAMDLMLQLAAEVDLDGITILGDWGDFAEWTKKYTREQEFREVTQPTLAEGTWWLKQLRMLNEEAEMHFLLGNHEDRIRDSLLNHYEQAYDLAPGGDLSAAPIVSVERMFRLSELGIEVSDPYPHGEVWYNDVTKAIHGEIARKKPGSTVRKLAKEETVNVVQGHVHRMEYQSDNVEIAGDQIPRWTFSPGCMCRVETGIVPSAKHRMNWQHGLGLLHVDPDGTYATIEPIRIHDGSMVYRGRRYEAQSPMERLRGDVGYGDRLLSPYFDDGAS